MVNLRNFIGQASGLANTVIGTASGIVGKVRAPKDVDDTTITHKVEPPKKKTPTKRFEKKPRSRTGDRVTDIASKREATPKEKAAKGEGRTPAPLGSEDTKSEERSGSIARPTV